MPKLLEGTKYIKRYSEDNVKKALEAIQADGMSVRKAGQLYGVPRATIQFRLSNQFKNKTTLGPSPILSPQEEDLLEKWILAKHRKVFPRRKEDIQASVKDMLDAKPRPNPFKENFPGEGWYKAFLKRHPKLTDRSAEAFTVAGAKTNEADVRKWFSNVDEYLKEAGIGDILKDPTRVYNGDETNFQLCPKSNKVLAPRDARKVNEVEGAPPKSNITVMFTFSASGHVTPPMLVYPYQRLPTDIVKSVPQDWGLSCTETGWMKPEVFYEYIRNVLYPYLQKSGIKFPIILFVDGHSAHLTYRVSQLCTELNIILVAIYPSATRLLPPADVAAFKPLKSTWKKGVAEFQRQHPHEVITKEKFAPLLSSMLSTVVTQDVVKNGFRAWGLFPWNPSAINYTKCLRKDRAQYAEKNEVRNTNLYLSWDDFEKTVGQERLKLFKSIDEAFDRDSNFRCDHSFPDIGELTLYRLYRQFRPRPVTGNPTVTNENNTEPNTIHEDPNLVAAANAGENLEFLYRPHPADFQTAANNFVPGSSNLHNNNYFP